MAAGNSRFPVLCWFLALAWSSLALGAVPCADLLVEQGSVFDAKTQTLQLRIFSARATRLVAHLFAVADGPPVATYALTRHGDLWTVDIAAGELKRLGLMDAAATDLDRFVYYGFRAWGPNWPYVSEWTPGTDIGFVADVDAEGNRFNPNKLLTDPFAREVSHDPRTSRQPDGYRYLTGSRFRTVDTAASAPKGIVLPAAPPPPIAPGPTRAFKDEIVYEVNVRGFTRNDPSVPEAERGTYRGAARKARYLREMGFTAIELLPVHQFQSEANRPDLTEGNNYWGYMTLAFFAPNRRYATEESCTRPGGVTAEFREMVDAFHREGIKVILDVVYNHTGEGGVGDGNPDVASLHSFRGLDNATYYQLGDDPRYYQNNSGCGGNFNCRTRQGRDLILASIRYWISLGVDALRFDLAAVLGNGFSHGFAFRFDPVDEDGLLWRMLEDLPVRAPGGGPGIDLIVEPWGIGSGTYQLGRFPYDAKTGRGFIEWNGAYRDTIRRSVNRAGWDDPTPGQLAARIAGSSDIFARDRTRPGRKPWHSLNFVVAHDGFTGRDVVSYDRKRNDQPAPFGPSDGGEDHNHSWDQSVPGDAPDERASRQRQAARNIYLLPLLSLGVPMVLGGDEMYRTQNGNNNMWNVDSVGSWLDWTDAERSAGFVAFARAANHFRRTHAALRPAEYADGEDHDGNGLRDLMWYRSDGTFADRDLPAGAPVYMDDPDGMFLAWRLDAEEAGEKGTRSIFVAYHWGGDTKTIQLPPPAPGREWYWAGDTAARWEATGNFRMPGEERPLEKVNGPLTAGYAMAPRSVLVLIER